MSHIVIVSRALKEPIRLLLGPTPPTITSGYATYADIERPKRKAAVDWTGSLPFSMSVEIMLDGLADDLSVETECRQIESLATPNHAKLVEPRQLTIFGPVPHSNLRWIVTNISWGDVIYSEAGYRVRQLVTLDLRENVKLKKIIANDVKRNRVRYRNVVVKKGYDLRQIAAVMLGDSSLWRRITTMKGKKFRDPYVKPGTKIKVPIR